MEMQAGEILGRYLIESTIGEGGMARVYRATHQILGSRHAIKVLHPHLASSEEIRRRFLDEGKIQAWLRHPGILPVTDLIAESGVAGLVMDLLEGEDLETFLARERRVPTATALAWIAQVLDALAYVHEHDVVHRDLKPSNLFLVRAPGGAVQVRLMDFGIAKVRDRRLTNHGGGMMGTLCYMSPEQVSSPADVDHRTDLFAVGAILYELVTGLVAFHDESDFLIMQRIAEGRFSPPDPTLPPGLVAVIDQALAAKPEDRFESAAAFREAVEAAGREERQRRLARLLSLAEEKHLDPRWWTPEDPPEGWLRRLEQKVQDWLQEGGSDPGAPRPSARRTLLEPPLSLQLPGGLSLDLVALPGGEFAMGSPADAPVRHADEEPRRRVRLSPFHAMTTPVTQGQWQALMGDNPAHFRGDPRRPVESVGWLDAIRFCNQLSRHAGLEPVYRWENDEIHWNRQAAGYRLPTEAEWEHLARGDSESTYPWGYDPGRLPEFAWFKDNSKDTTHPVAALAPGPAGLYDLLGNVWEWCWDWTGPYSSAGDRDPIGPPIGETRIFRGGSFRSPAADLRPALRNGREPDFTHFSLGFRCVRGEIGG